MNSSTSSAAIAKDITATSQRAAVLAATGVAATPTGRQPRARVAVAACVYRPPHLQEGRVDVAVGRVALVTVRRGIHRRRSSAPGGYSTSHVHRRRVGVGVRAAVDGRILSVAGAAAPLATPPSTPRGWVARPVRAVAVAPVPEDASPPAIFATIAVEAAVSTIRRAAVGCPAASRSRAPAAIVHRASRQLRHQGSHHGGVAPRTYDDTASDVHRGGRPLQLARGRCGEAADRDHSPAPPPPPSRTDAHRFRHRQPRKARLGGAVHLHARRATQVASGILVTRVRATRTAPADADRVDDDQPRSDERIGRAVKLHQSSWGRARGESLVQKDALHIATNA